MKITLFSCGLFLAGFLVHWLLWRIRVPANANTSLLAAFLTVLGLGLLAGRFVSYLHPFSPTGIWEYLHVSLFYVAMTLGYIITYSALEEDSPSTTMVKYVSLAGAEGRAREEFEGLITDDQVVGTRLRAMVQSGMAVRDASRFRLTPQGILWQRIFSSWMRLLGITIGG